MDLYGNGPYDPYNGVKDGILELHKGCNQALRNVKTTEEMKAVCNRCPFRNFCARISENGTDFPYEWNTYELLHTDF